MNEWKEAIIDELVVAHIYSSKHDTDPRKAIHDIITWNCQVALDPLVSSDAQALIEQGRQQALQQDPRTATAAWSDGFARGFAAGQASVVDQPLVKLKTN